jgi:60 kDa SS-A/Ro ribonucleoprotein
MLLPASRVDSDRLSLITIPCPAATTTSAAQQAEHSRGWARDDLTKTNVDVLFKAIAEDGPRLVALITEISTAQPARAPKPRPALFALAAAAAKGDPATVQAVKAAFPRVVRTTDHLAAFFGYWKNLSGKPISSRGSLAPVIGRAMRAAFSSWFAGDLHDVAFRALKARQRATPTGEAMALRDIIRISHPTPESPQHRALIGWLAGKTSDDVARTLLRDVDNFLTAQAVTTPAEAIAVIRERRVPWEFLPSSVLNDADVWAELTGTIGVTALIRNLAKMTRIGTLGPFMSPAVQRVVTRLANGEALIKARVHPMDLYLALKVYQSGVSRPDPRKPAQTWQPAGAIVDALETGYELSFGAVEPSGKRLLIGVDSSGSMTHYSRVVSGGSPLGTAFEVANTMAVMLARIERANVHVINVDTSVHPSRVTARANLREIASWPACGGGTDMSLPFSWALDQRLNVDGVIVFTDNETWAGRRHPVQALDAYRRSVNPQARVIVVSMTAAGYSIGDPDDPGVLNVAGLDGSLPKLITGFIR